VLAKPLAQIDRSRLLLLIWPATTRYSSEVKAMLNNKADHDDKEQGNRT